MKTAAMYRLLESMTCNNVIDIVLTLKEKDNGNDILYRVLAEIISEEANVRLNVHKMCFVELCYFLTKIKRNIIMLACLHRP